MKYNESIGTQMSDVGNVRERYRLSKDNTRDAVSSHHSKEVWRIQESSPKAGRAAMDERRAHDETLRDRPPQ